jgi:hypothetical protein
MNHGSNLAKLVAHARGLGVDVCALRRTGELQFSHWSQQDRPRLNGRRKDAPRHASVFVRRVEQCLAAMPPCSSAQSRGLRKDQA